MKTSQSGTTRTCAFPPKHIMRSARRAAALLLLCVAIAPTAFADVRYVISLADPQRHLVQVTMEIPAGRDSHELQLSVWYALYQVRDFSKYMDWIRAETATGQPLQLTQINKSRWKINGTAQGARVVYEMFSDDPGSYGAQLNAHHAFFNLAEILLYADDLRDGAVKVSVKNLPPQWKIATPLQQQGSDYTSQNYDRLVDSPMEAGTFEEQDFAGTCGRYQVVLDWEVAQGEEEAKLKSRGILAEIV